MIKEKINKIKKILSFICFLMIFINFFFPMTLISKIAVGIILLITTISLRIEQKELQVAASTIVVIAIFVLPFCYYFGTTNYKLNQNPILYSENIKEITYEFNNIDATFYITGKGETTSFIGSSEMPWKKYIKGILHVNIDNDITKIGNSLFSQCEKIKDVKLSDNTISIGHFAFADCSDLTSFNTKKKNTIVLPENCIAIGDLSFSNCNKIKTIFIPETVIYIGESAFNIQGLEKIYYEGNEDAWERLIKQSNAIPDSCKIYYNSTIDDL